MIRLSVAVASVVMTILATTSCHESPSAPQGKVPASITILSGSGQSDTIGAQLPNPLVVRVTASDSSGVPSVTVRFQATADGLVQPALATTDATGTAFVQWTVRTHAGADTVFATVPTLQNQKPLFTATVQPGRLALLVLSPDTVRFFRLQDSLQVRAVGKDRHQDTTTFGPLLWSSNNQSITSVNRSGLVRSVAKGSATVSSVDTSTGVRGIVAVVVDQVPNAVKVTPSKDTLNWIGETVGLTAAASDSGGYAVASPVFTWLSLNQTVAHVDSTGRVNGVASGTARVVAQYRSVADTAIIVVRQVPASMTVNPSLDTLRALADTARLSVTVRDSGGTPVPNPSVAWSSSNASLAQVDSTGKVLARANGSATIQAKASGIASNAIMTVRQKLAKVHLTPDSVPLAIGGSQQMNRSLSDSNGFQIDTTVVPVRGTWRSRNVNWVYIDQTGLVSARAAGRTSVAFSADSVAGTSVSVVSAPTLGIVQGWNWKNPLPQGNTLNGVWGSSNADVYAVGANSAIVHYDGTTWTPTRLDMPALVDVWVSATGQAFIAGFLNGGGIVARGRVGAWTVDTVDRNNGVRAVWGFSDTSVYAVTDGLAVIKFNGAAWSQQATLPLNQVQDIQGISPTRLFVAGAVNGTSSSQGVVYGYDGTAWTELYRGFTSVMRLWVAPDSSVYALGRNPPCSVSVLHSRGAAWDTVATFPYDLLSIHGRSVSDIYAAGVCASANVEAKVHWDGVSWTTETGPLVNYIQGLWAPAGGTWVAVGGFGSIQTNSGTGWQTLTSGLRGQQYNVRGLDMWLWSANEAYMTTHDTRVLRWNGSQLAEVATPVSGVPGPINGVSRPLNAVWGTSPSNLYVGGGYTCTSTTDPTACDGVLMHFDGTSWTVLYNQGIIIDEIWGAERDDIFALGNGGGYHFDGQSWSRTGVGVFEGSRIKAVWGSSGSDVWACGDSRNLYHYDGSTWTFVTSIGIGCGEMFGFSSTNVYAIGYKDGPTGTQDAIGHFDGTSWSVVYTGVGVVNGGYDETTIWGSGPNDVHASFGSEYVHFDGSSWSRQPLPPMTPLIIRGDGLGSILGSGEVAGLVIGHQ